MKQVERISMVLVLLLAAGCGESDPKTGGVAQIDVDTDTIEFESTEVGMSTDAEVTIASYGSEVLEITRIALEPQRDEFQISTNLAALPHPAGCNDPPRTGCPITLESGREQTIRITYTPQELGVNPTSTLVIECNDRKMSRIEIPISVIEYSPRLVREPTLLQWGYDVPRQTNLACQETIGRKTITLRNEGSGSLHIAGYELKGRNLPEGEVAQDHFSVCPQEGYESTPISGSGSQIWTVVFHPKTGGEKRATLTLQSNGGNATVELIGGAEGRSSLEVSSTLLSWPELQQGQSGVKTLDLVNTGTLPIDVQSIMVMPTPKRPFYSITGATYLQGDDQASGRLATPIQPNQSARLEITYQASQPNPVEADLEIHHTADTPPSPLIVRLIGNATTPQMVVEPMQVAFGGISPGVSEQRSLVVKNLGNAELLIDRIEIGADGAALGFENFTCHPDPCANITLQPNAFKAFQIAYHRPLDAIQLEDRGCANIFSNDPDQQPSFCVSLLASNLQGNMPPSAVITTDPANPTIPVGTTISLSCAESTDPDEGQSIARCDWLLVDWPSASRASLSLVTGDVNTPTRLTPDVVGRYRVVLVVTDDSPTAFVSPEEDIEIIAQ